MGGKWNGNTVPKTKENTKFLTIKEKQVLYVFKMDSGYQFAIYIWLDAF